MASWTIFWINCLKFEWAEQGDWPIMGRSGTHEIGDNTFGKTISNSYPIWLLQNNSKHKTPRQILPRPKLAQYLWEMAFLSSRVKNSRGTSIFLPKKMCDCYKLLLSEFYRNLKFTIKQLKFLQISILLTNFAFRYATLYSLSILSKFLVFLVFIMIYKILLWWLSLLSVYSILNYRTAKILDYQVPAFIKFKVSLINIF